MRTPVRSIVVMALALLVLLMVGLVGMMLDRQQVTSQLAIQLEGLMGPAGRELVNSILTTTNPEGGAWATVVSLVTLLIGATAVLFTLGKTAIGYYLGYASVGSAYGAAGSMVVLLVWVYYSALIVFFGAEFTQAWATRHGAVAPQPHAVSVNRV